MSSETDVGEVVFRRFRRLVVRRWWIPAGFGLLFGILLGGTSRTSHQAIATISAIKDNSVLQSVGFEPEVISQAIPLNVDAAAVSGDDFEAKVSAAVGHSVSASLTTSKDPEAITVVVVTNTQESAIAARAMYVDAITESRTTRFETLIDSLAKQQAENRSLMEKRVAELDSELAGLSDPSSSLAFALLADRSKISEHLIDVDSAAAALESLKAKPTEAFTVTGDPTVIPITDTKIKVVAGGSFGILVGLAVLYAMAVLDRRIRSRRDLASTGFEMIAALPRGSTSTDMDRLARLVVSLANQKGSSVVQMLPADNDPLVADLLVGAAAAIESAQNSISVHILKSLDADPQPLTDDGIFVVVTRYGETRSRDVERVAADLTVAGRSSGGVVLVDVPPRELSWARSNIDELPGSD